MLVLMSRAIAKKIFQKNIKENNMGIKVVHKEICIFKKTKKGMEEKGKKSETYRNKSWNHRYNSCLINN